MITRCGLWYCTEYRSGDASYESTLWARSMREAKRIAKMRGMGEKIYGYGRHPDFTRASRLFYGNRKPLEVLHAVSFLCSIASAARIAAGRLAMSDQGILHEVLHYYLFHNDRPALVNGRRFYSHRPRRVLYDRLIALEKSVPGYVQR